MNNAEEIEKEFIENIGKLKKGKWGNDDSEIDEAINSGYKLGISDVQTMLSGEFVDELEFTTATQFAQTHTNQTLQELKEKVQSKGTVMKMDGDKWVRIDKVITLIDEAIND